MGDVMTTNLLALAPGSVTLAQLEVLYWDSPAITLDPACRPGVEAAAAVIAKAAKLGEPVYGINTGFGKLANTTIAPGDTVQLQRNLILSHCCGVGAPLPRNIVRLIMALKLLSLGRGASGV